MKKCILITAALCAFNASASLKSGNAVKYQGDLAYSGFCEAVITNDVQMLKRSLRHKVGEISNSSKGVLKKLVAKDGIQCNGVDLVSFSMQRNAPDVHAYIKKSL